MEKKIELHLQGMTTSQVQSGAYALILMDESTKRHIPVVVGMTEAQSIAIAVEGVPTPRPLTHDLIVSMANKLGLTLELIFIYKFEDGVFFSELWFKKGEETIKIDSRTSDAIAIALRMKAPIYTTEDIVDECGVNIEEESDEKKSENEHDFDFDVIPDKKPEEIDNEKDFSLWLSQHETDELKEYLQEAITNENYEMAKKLQDEISCREQKRKKGKQE